MHVATESFIGDSSSKEKRYIMTKDSNSAREAIFFNYLIEWVDIYLHFSAIVFMRNSFLKNIFLNVFEKVCMRKFLTLNQKLQKLTHLYLIR